jgi:hypothetical protein
VYEAGRRDAVLILLVNSVTLLVGKEEMEQIMSENQQLW